MDCGLAAGGDRAARPASAPRHRRHDCAGLSGAGARASARHHSGDIPSAAAGRDFHRAYRLSGHADAANGGGAEDLDGAWRERRARRHQKTGDGHQPRRQQRGDEPCGAGSACAIRTSRCHHGMVSLRRAGGIIFSGRIASRHPWWRGRDIDHAGAISANTCGAKRSPIFVPPASRWKRIIAGSRRTGRRRLRGRPRIFTPAAPPAMPRRPRRRRASACSITARARSANCLPRSITST